MIPHNPKVSSRAKPLKRPSQARAKATVQAVFDAFGRIWQREGWDRITTRAVALETGIAIGTLYDYFPGKAAIQSGYVRYCIESLIAKVDVEAVQPPHLSWRERIHRTLQIVCGVAREGLPWFHPEMLELEPSIAELKHQRRAHEELRLMWQRVFDACADIPCRPSGNSIDALHLAVWGGRRYMMLLQLEAAETEQWAQEMERLCLLMIDTQAADR